MSIFRSELMLHKRIRIPIDNCLEIMNELGKLEDSLEFVDLTKDNFEAKKNFGSMIKRCDEMERLITKFEKICEDYKEKFSKFSSYKQFTEELSINEQELKDKKIQATYFDYVENEVFEDDKKITELIAVFNTISEAFETLIEKKSVFDKVSNLISQDNLGSGLNISKPKMKGGYAEVLEDDVISSDLNILAGVIKAEDDIKLKRMVFRISRGRAIPQIFNLNDNSTLPKKIFVVFFQGNEDSFLKAKLGKILDIFSASRFKVPNRNEISQEITHVQNDINEKRTFLRQAETSIRDFIVSRIGAYKTRYELYRMFFRKEKLIFNNLNKCVVRGNFIDGEVWIPNEKFISIQQQLREITNRNDFTNIASFYDIIDEEGITPPTFIKTNDFTWAFQQIVDTYGVPRYREINPTLFNIVTFPFLFGVMFGDIGHGLLLFLGALYLVMNKDELSKSPSFKQILKARWLFLLMGFFACYVGWIYNDLLSIPINIFGTCFRNEKEESVHQKGCTYPFGMDPKWYVASNELTFFNSFKMKFAVIAGVLQMTFGIILRGLNSLHFGHKVDFIFEFIPQVVFMGLLFGYMNVMIIAKWTIDYWVKDDKGNMMTYSAPSIITQLMQIFLKMGDVGPYALWGGEGEQEAFHFRILIVCLICIPILLFPKPIYVWLSLKNKSSAEKKQFQKFDEEKKEGLIEGDHKVEENVHGGDHDEDHGFGEIFIHQVIETIEFVLGSISNTASYLRLWALSLAHAQLAKVFFEKLLLGAIHDANVIGIIIGYYFFAAVTAGILMFMDLMECFLHTLRLHWVEFQNKFYKADGYRFNPYCFKYIVETDE